MNDDERDIADSVADNMARYHREMREFAKMEEGIRDIDYYKAETEAARNGHTAAMAFADAKSAESTAWRSKFNSASEEIDGLKKDVEKLMGWFTKALVFIVVSFLLGMLIGAWIW
jgi:hypothetical protein